MMPNIVINEVSVDFPHQNPYDVQKRFMENVIDSIENSKNSVLESPTGTGKTLSLLCSTLGCIQRQQAMMDAFLQRQNDAIDTGTLESENPVPPWLSNVVFTSRTHSQLKQAMGELSSTNYSKTVKSAILGAREQFCINPEVLSQSPNNINVMCRSKVKRKDCSFYKTFEENIADQGFMQNEILGKVLDIEELVMLGTKKGFCPYFMSQHMAEDAEIVFSPYNYVLEERNRSNNSTIFKSISHGIVVFDEAHNIPQICEDLSSIEFSYDDILTALNDVEYVFELLLEIEQQDLPEFKDSDLTALQRFIQRFQGAIDEIVISNPLHGVELDGEFIFTLMDKSDIGCRNAVNIIGLIDQIIDFLAAARRLSHCGRGLRQFKEILWVPFADSGEGFIKEVKRHYRVYAGLKKDDESQVIVPHEKIYNFWCFSAKFVLEKLVKQMHTRSVIFTSGTLSPLEPFIESLCIPITTTLQNSHIVSKSQVLVQVIANGSDGEKLDSSFNNRSTDEYINSLGRTILSLCPVIPDGLLVFFTSYKVLINCKNKWMTSGIWSAIHKQKAIFIEPQHKKDFLPTMEGYYATINDPRTKGAIFIGVLRGKVAEGLDFEDANGRAVIITGIPFPPWKDPKVQMKWKYLDFVGGGSNGQEWYNLEASRAVNQAVGRIIRHKNDFGAVLLLDGRYRESRHKRQFPTWIRNHFDGSNSNNGFGNVVSSIAQFFRRHQTLPNRTTITANRAIGSVVARNIAIAMEADEDEINSEPFSAVEYNLLFENAM